MFPKFITAFMKASGEAGVVVMEHEGAQRIVVVEREALEKIGASSKADESRLQESVGPICEIAASKIVVAPQSPFSPVRVGAADVTAWKLARQKLN